MTSSELELIAARDHDAMARFYDQHVAMVGEFCAAVCPDEEVDDTVAAVFLNFLGRASQAPPDAQPEELLRRAAREIAASRMETSADESGDPACEAMPELLAARVNGELSDQERALGDHLSHCPTCQATAARLGQAEIMYPVGSPGGVTELRAAWLQLAGGADKASDASEWLARGAGGEPTVRGNDPGHPADNGRAPQPPPQRQQPVRARRGGLVSAVRRLAASSGARAPTAPHKGT